RVRQNGEQFLIINGVWDENRFVLSLQQADPGNDKQRQREQTRTRGGAKLRLRNESRRFHANLFLRNLRFPYTIDFTAAVKTLARCAYESTQNGNFGNDAFCTCIVCLTFSPLPSRTDGVG